MLSQLNSSALYLIVAVIILFVAAACVLFMVRAYRAGKAIGMDEKKLKTTITASATFAILPAVGILLGVIALSGSLGTPLPWLRLSVIGALHYETQVAEAAAENIGLSGLNASEMTAEAFVTIAFVMSACIIWGMVFSILFTKKYLSGSRKKETAADNSKPKKKSPFAGFGDTAMTAMFIGLVSCYIGNYIATFVSGNGVLTFSGSLIPLLVACVGAIAMGIFILIKEKKQADWIDNFSIAASMLIAMAAAVVFGMFLG